MKKTLTFIAFVCFASFLSAQVAAATSAADPQPPAQQPNSPANAPETDAVVPEVIMSMTSNAFEESKVVTPIAANPTPVLKESEARPVETQAVPKQNE